MSGHQQTEEEWWEEDARRLNEMCAIAHKNGWVVTKPVEQPELNSGGTYKTDTTPAGKIPSQSTQFR
mgnify:CR=1 FL=1